MLITKHWFPSLLEVSVYYCIQTNTRIDLGKRERRRDGRKEGERERRKRRGRNKGRNRFYFQECSFYTGPCLSQARPISTHHYLWETHCGNTLCDDLFQSSFWHCEGPLALLSPMRKDRLSCQRLFDCQAGQGSRPFKSMACSLFTMLSCLTETKSKASSFCKGFFSKSSPSPLVYRVSLHTVVVCSLNLAGFL